MLPPGQHQNSAHTTKWAGTLRSHMTPTPTPRTRYTCVSVRGPRVLIPRRVYLGLFHHALHSAVSRDLHVGLTALEEVTILSRPGGGTPGAEMMRPETSIQSSERIS